MSDSQQDSKPTHTKKLGNKQFVQYLKSQPTTTTMIFNIEKFLSKFDPFYYNSFLYKIKARPFEKIQALLQKEYNDLLNGKSFFHKMNNAIQSRTKGIDKIKRDLRKVQQILKAFKKAYFKKNSKTDEVVMQYTEGQGFSMLQINESIEHSVKMINELFADIYRLRDMTIYIIETIHRWRIQLQEWMDKCGQHSRVDYYFQGKNYFHTLYDDINFIWESKLSEYIWFEHKQDPLIIRNVIYIEQKEDKEILEKYFVESLYPQNQMVIEKSIKCLEMLTFQYKPQQINLYEEQQKLIQNYLGLERKNNEEAGLYEDPQQQANKLRMQVQGDNYKWSKTDPNVKNKKQSHRGWIFGKQLKKPATQKVRQIVNKHQKEMIYLGKHKLKPYNITNFSQKNSIALAYLDEKKKSYSSNQYVKVRNMNNIVYADDENLQKDDEVQLYSQNKRQKQENNRLANDSKRMFSSLTKFDNVIIHEDPKQYDPDTPKNKKKKYTETKKTEESKLFQSRGRQTLAHNIKINTLVNPVIDEKNKAEIQVDGEEAPMNLRQFFQVFRADTNKDVPQKKESASRILQKHKLKGSFSIKRIVDRKRAESLKNLPYYKKKPVIKKKGGELSKSKSKESQKSFESFTKVQSKNLSQSKIIGYRQGQYISIESKRITSDMIGMYVRHLMIHLPVTSKSFTNYSQRKLISLLQDIDIHSMLFDLVAQKDGHIGQALVVQSLSNRMRLKYQIQFINVSNFDLLLSSISRIAQQLLSTTPCEEVVCKLMEDKMDPVSVHFINLIDEGLKIRSQKFCLFHILEKKIPGYHNKDPHQRIYIFESKNNMIKEKLYRKKMMSNYRSLTFQTKCLLLSSNFKLRSQNLLKDLIQTYKDYSIGSLFIRVLSRIMNKYNMKQLKIASMSITDADDTVGLVKNNPFLRSLFYGLLQYSKNIKGSQNESDWLKIHMTKFSNMTDLLNYLNYKEYDTLFKFDFLNESRFILSHELHISEVNLNMSLQFTVTATPSILSLNNHRNYVIQSISSDSVSAFLLPTTQDGVKLLLMDASQYQICTDRLDLFSYIQLFFRDRPIEQLHDVPQISLPNISKMKPKVFNIKTYQGMSRLFPQRQFYSATMFSASNLWQSFYPNAVISLPQPNSIIMEFPFIIGFYDTQFKSPIVTFLYKDATEVDPLSKSKLMAK